jgi:hypothetical protein
MMFRDVTTVLNERKNFKMESRSVPDSVSLFLGRTEWLGLTALHHAQVERSSNGRPTSYYIQIYLFMDMYEHDTYIYI